MASRDPLSLINNIPDEEQEIIREHVAKENQYDADEALEIILEYVKDHDDADTILTWFCNN